MTAGRLVHCVCYTQALASDCPKARAEKAKCSSAARRKLNFIFTYEKLQLYIAANFTRRDLYVTLSYDDEHLPKGRKEAGAALGRFMRRFGDARKKAGEVFKYIKSTHELLDDGGRRLHHHLVINAGDARRDFDLIRSLWEYGDNIDIQQISDTAYYFHDDFLELAMYIARERNPDAPPTSVGARCWSGSRNLKKPARLSIMVDDNVTVDAPPGAFVLDTDERRNEFGMFKYLKYLLPERPAPVGRAQGGRPPGAKVPGAKAQGPGPPGL